MNNDSAMQIALGQAAFDRGYNDRMRGGTTNPYHAPSQGFLHGRYHRFRCVKGCEDGILKTFDV